MKPTLAFVDNVFHQYTMSADFFREFLSPHFEITNYWDKTSQKGPAVSVEEINKHNYVIFWQRLNPICDLEKITAQMIWVPMYDSLNPDYWFWKNLSLIPIKVICFSKKIYEKCQKFGIEAVYIQYWIKPEENLSPFKERAKTFFMWDRGPVPFSLIKKVVNPKFVEKFIYLSRPDPGFKAEEISEEDIRDYKIEKVEMEFKSSKRDYIDLVKKAGVFIAPRKKEGIGLSFIEAISMGLVVIANNEGTMNEYIENGFNGYLIDSKTESIDLEKIEEIESNSRSTAEEGYKNWLTRASEIFEFIKTESLPKKQNSIEKFFFKKIYELKIFQHKIRNRYLS